MTEKGLIEITISYDQQLVADGLSAIMSRFKGFYVSSSFKNADLNDEDFRKMKSKIHIVEFCQVSSHSINYVRKIRDLNPHLKLLIVSNVVSHTILEKLMHVVDGFLLRTCSSSELNLGLHQLLDAGKYLCPKLLDLLLKEETEEFIEEELTKREIEILCLWLSLNSYTDISDTLNITESTVRTHLKNIRQKFGNANQLQMMIYACQKNLFPNSFKPKCPNCRLYCSIC